MRKTEINGIKISYPEEVVMAFNPVIVDVDAGATSMASLTVSVRPDLTMTYKAYGNRCTADIRELMQATMATEELDYEPDYSAAKRTGETKSLLLSITGYTPSGEKIFQFNSETYAVWGALYQGETFNGKRRLTYFEGYPFTFGIYGGYNDADPSATPDRLIIAADGTDMQQLDYGNGVGIYNIPLPLTAGARHYEVYDLRGNLRSMTFDATFDTSFHLSQGKGVRTKVLDIDVAQCRFDNPVYLRWIDRQGFLCHWLFREGERQTATTTDGEFLRNNLPYWDEGTGWRGTNGRRQGYGREDTQQICAPLIDREQFDMLQDIATSPIVDMWLADTKKWVHVTVRNGTYTKLGDASLQDFQLEIVREAQHIQGL